MLRVAPVTTIRLFLVLPCELVFVRRSIPGRVIHCVTSRVH